MASDSRKAAYSAITRCLKSGGWSSRTIDSAIKSFQLEGRDAALSNRLVLGVLQNTTLLDYYIDFFCSSPDTLQPEVRNIMRMGAYQILFSSKIPPHAAVNESVELCREVKLSRASGLVNAVLRKIAANKEKLPEIPGEGTAEYLSIKYSHPLWLVNRLAEEYGFDKTEAFLRADNEIPSTDIQVNITRISPEAYCHLLEERGIKYSAAENPESLTLDFGRVTELPGFDEGFFYVQDAAAHSSVLMADIKEGMTVLDACSAPGGKSFAAANMMNCSGKIIACDIHEKKLSLVRASAERLGINIIETRQADASEYNPQWDLLFDVVIADVPCSGMGVIAKKPEIKFKKEEELSSLPAIQSRIIENLSRYVKRGGTLLYSTCTVFKEENEEIVKSFLDKNKEFELSCSRQFLPGTESTDGFYAAALIRR